MSHWTFGLFPWLACRRVAVFSCLAACIMALALPAPWVYSQVVVAPGGGRVITAPGGTPMATPTGGAAAAAAGGAAAAPSGGEAQKTGDAAEGEQKKGEADKPADSVKRPSKPPRVPDPREFDAKLDHNETVKFSFNGQSWPDVLQWLASLGGWSLDWQELPNDYINLSTNRPYTIDEVRDLLNRLLFDRGYTMILRRDVLLVSKIDKLDPSLLPRIEDQSKLVDLPAHDFVKMTFQLPDALKADQAAADVKPLLSKHAQVQPLMATNRLLVIDLVGNLRGVSQLINMEHAAAVGLVVPKEYPIRFARAGYVADQVMILLGLDPATRRTPQELQVEQQKLQLFMQMQQKGNDISKYLRPGETPLVHIAVNPRNNSIVVNAPKKELAIIERAIEMLDVPSGQLTGATAADLQMEKYQLATVSAEAIVTALEEIGDLDPRTRFKLASDAKVVFASATERDHAKIKEMIGQLDGSGRQLEVIWLRRLPADAVAETVFNLMVGQQEEENDNNNGMYFYGYRGRSQEKQEPAGKGFRVDADIENNRLLLWANEQELEEVKRFLVKLGEIPGQAGNPNRVRVLDTRSADDTRKLLEQLRVLWPSMGENDLKLEVIPSNEPAAPSPAAPAPSAPTPSAPEVNLKNASFSRSTADALAQAGDGGPGAEVAEEDMTAAEVPGDASAAGQPPITVAVDADGRIVISSRDTEALDRLEDLIARIAPPKKDYEVFYLKFALASYVTLNLEEYFADDGSKSDDEENYWRGWYGVGMADKDSDSRGGLSRRQPIRFIYDYDTNSVLVANASSEQLEVVRDLIEIYDKPPSEDSISARRYQIFKLQYAKASDVAATVKEVYRDLLSSKDQVFQNGGEKEQGSQTTNYVRLYGSTGMGGDDEAKKPTKVKASFAGALSVGVDEVSNSIIVSAQEEWMSSVAEMIEYLDTSAEPYRPSVQVLNTSLNARHLQAALLKAVGPSAPAKANDQQPGQTPQNGQNQPAATPMNPVIID